MPEPNEHEKLEGEQDSDGLLTESEPAAPCKHCGHEWAEHSYDAVDRHLRTCTGAAIQGQGVMYYTPANAPATNPTKGATCEASYVEGKRMMTLDDLLKKISRAALASIVHVPQQREVLLHRLRETFTPSTVIELFASLLSAEEREFMVDAVNEATFSDPLAGIFGMDVPTLKSLVEVGTGADARGSVGTVPGPGAHLEQIKYAIASMTCHDAVTGAALYEDSFQACKERILSYLESLDA